jgi:hypothetical protein
MEDNRRSWKMPREPGGAQEGEVEGGRSSCLPFRPPCIPLLHIRTAGKLSTGQSVHHVWASWLFFILVIPARHVGPGTCQLPAVSFLFCTKMRTT